ncbi:hydroxyphenylacetyl-CoA thioesterase PaaI [Pseudovibrio exalbescens]|uniref:hydroxyphenylacetyl-CoA thioesterase PaaI n=1 Tax=Pseudovibrio exalbescens TaxID=197461 RepID=UPI002366624E|nr:hydroxyphenylacetyl-CoA thioesterase PaaI [Pseudovibrio exalbescens]MDD7910745.1 hydroxyphenylacetyl-CoA thioesterase PaaI [Pseudovibrio exalbescens]
MSAELGKRPSDMTPDELAGACAQSMWADDEASQQLGMSLEHVAAGHARISMQVTNAMCNGHATAHGGFIFALADSAFAFACNSYNPRVVAQHCSITFVAPAFEGDMLVATAEEVTRFGRNGIYDIRVTKEDGSLIAEFRGHSRQVRGTHLPEGPEE